MLDLRNIVRIYGVDGNIFFESDSAEEIDLERDEVLNESLDSVADGDDVVLLDEGSIVSLEEGLGRASLIGYHTVDHGDLGSLFGLDILSLERDHLHVHVVSAAGRLNLLHLNEPRLGKSFFVAHIC